MLPAVDTPVVDPPAPVLDRLLRKADVVGLVALSYPTIWRQVRQGRFPAPVRISAGRVAWRESAIRAWMNGLPTSTIAPTARSKGRPKKRRAR